MPFYEREDKILSILASEECISTNNLAKNLFISLPTLRRDLIKLEAKGKIVKSHGKISLRRDQADEKIPFSLREEEASEAKIKMAKEAAKYIKDGDTVMLDASTSAYCIIPHLKEFKDIIVITSGAKAAILLAHLGIPNISSGGKMINRSFSYIGADAVSVLSRYNADVAFFSCRGLSDDGIPSDNSAEENEIRRIMIKQSKKRILLCDKSKRGKIYLNNLSDGKDIDVIISDE